MKLLKNREFIILVLIALVGLPMLTVYSVSNTLDLKLYYSVMEANIVLSRMGDKIQDIYLVHEYLDLIYMTLYSALFFSLMHRKSRHPLLLWFCTVPWTLDVFETMTIIGVLHESFCVPDWLGLITLLKWISILIVIGLLLIVWRIKLTAPLVWGFSW